MMERQWNKIVMADSEDVNKFTNRFKDATKRLTSSGIDLHTFKIVGNYAIAMKHLSTWRFRRRNLYISTGWSHRQRKIS